MSSPYSMISRAFRKQSIDLLVDLRGLVDLQGQSSASSTSTSFDQTRPKSIKTLNRVDQDPP